MGRTVRPVLVMALVVAALAVTACGTASRVADSATGDSPATSGAINPAPTVVPAPISTPPASTPRASGGGDMATGDAPLGAMEPLVDLPVKVVITPTEGLHNGQTVTVHVTPTGDTKLYGAEARLCSSVTPVANSADFAPTQGGLCTAEPLSPSSDSRLEVAGQAPYQSLDVAFRVGVGTDSFRRGDGTAVSITCDATHPCSLVVKVQVPNGFGFQNYPLTYA